MYNQRADQRQSEQHLAPPKQGHGMDTSDEDGAMYQQATQGVAAKLWATRHQDMPRQPAHAAPARTAPTRVFVRTTIPDSRLAHERWSHAQKLPRKALAVPLKCCAATPAETLRHTPHLGKFWDLLHADSPLPAAADLGISPAYKLEPA